MAKRLVRIYLEADPEGYVQFVNDLWARLPDADCEVVLDRRQCLAAANADYDARYRHVPPWSDEQVAESQVDAERFEASPIRPRRRHV